MHELFWGALKILQPREFSGVHVAFTTTFIGLIQPPFLRTKHHSSQCLELTTKTLRLQTPRVCLVPQV
jgi:hypothetical protein